jgi:hypothetical protein
MCLLFIGFVFTICRSQHHSTQKYQIAQTSECLLLCSGSDVKSTQQFLSIQRCRVTFKAQTIITYECDNVVTYPLSKPQLHPPQPDKPYFLKRFAPSVERKITCLRPDTQMVLTVNICGKIQQNCTYWDARYPDRLGRSSTLFPTVINYIFIQL